MNGILLGKPSPVCPIVILTQSFLTANRFILCAGFIFDYDHPVSRSYMSLNILGVGDIIFYLLPQRSHENPQRSNITINRITPYLIRYICMCQNLPGVLS